jgi:hypothetical protein
MRQLSSGSNVSPGKCHPGKCLPGKCHPGVFPVYVDVDDMKEPYITCWPEERLCGKMKQIEAGEWFLIATTWE